VYVKRVENALFGGFCAKQPVIPKDISIFDDFFQPFSKLACYIFNIVKKASTFVVFFDSF